MLPADPLLGFAVLVAVDGEAELVIRVVVASEVKEDGDALENGETAAVMVDDGGDAAVRVQGRVPWLLLRALADIDGLPGVVEAVGVPELLEEDGGFVAIWGALSWNVRTL